MSANMWRVYLPQHCQNRLGHWSICPDCVFHAMDNLLADVIKQVSEFDATVVFDGENESIEHQLINKYAEGTVQGYKDAVKQIKEFLVDLRESNKL